MNNNFINHVFIYLYFITLFRNITQFIQMILFFYKSKKYFWKNVDKF